MNNKLKKALKAQAHPLNLVILMGGKGLTENVIVATDEALTTHELIKVKLTGDEKADRSAIAQALCTATHADLIQIVGHIATLYRKNPVK
ncbi:MAG: ribosome assembly RNA-binding protein YhbY [Gammaproteobacteria bacterium]|nr:ribosome assembly RNA-binding protein YhbY [Gammaproteobacteria bacterium]